MALKIQHDDHAQVTMAFRVLGQHARMIHEAAEKRGLTAADLMRELVLEGGAKILGRPSPVQQAPVAPARLVEEAARAAGLDVREYERRAAREAALREWRGKEGSGAHRVRPIREHHSAASRSSK